MRLSAANALAPAARLISNGRYHVMLSAAGGGQSRCNGLALNECVGSIPLATDGRTHRVSVVLA